MRHLEMTIVQAGGGSMRGGITCRAGEVTVLRAFTESALRPFQQLFAAGTAGASKAIFEALADGRSIEPADLTVIGLGKDFTDSGQRLWEFMRHSGIPAEHVPHLLITYNFPHSEEFCVNLQPQFARVARILAASYQAEKILVLNDPFAPLSIEWRERLAEFIAIQASSMQQIVLVTSLSARPQCWIGNELITRIQIEESFNMTIGHGGSAAHLRNLVEQVRSAQASLPIRPAADLESRAGRRVDRALTSLPDENDERPDWNGWLLLAEKIEQVKKLLIGSSQWGPFHSAALAFAVACCFFALKLWSSGPPAVKNTAPQPASAQLVQPKQKSKRARKPRGPAALPGNANADAALPPAPAKSALDFYPPEISHSILAALAGSDQTTTAQTGQTAEIKEQRPLKKTKRRRRSTEKQHEHEQSASEENNSVVPPEIIQPAAGGDLQEWELRRREQRERFLSAIRAGEQLQPAEREE